MEQEIQETRRLLYVSLTRPRDSLIITLEGKQTGGGWMDTLQADWMLPAADTLTLPDGTSIPSRVLAPQASASDTVLPDYQPTWLTTDAPAISTLPLRVSPSAIAPDAAARIGEIITLGDRLDITGEYDPATLGSALHAVIATTLLGQHATARVLQDHGMDKTIAVAAADESASRLLAAIQQRFKPIALHAEYPVHYSNDSGQLISGWIDLLVETAEGFVLIDHKASPRARSDWEEIALGYAGQLAAYAEGIARATGRSVISRWIHFGVTGGLVSIKNNET
jgi:ATP-dependent helicase/nuclease subunit A